jgi:hypothetical protein
VISGVSDFGKLSVETDATGATTAVVWQRTPQETMDTDIAYYELSIRAKLPDAATAPTPPRPTSSNPRPA